MTGFSRSSGNVEKFNWVWEVKSLNSRGIDIRFRVPKGLDELEFILRPILLKKISRGSITVNLKIDSLDSGENINLNHENLNSALKIIEEINKKINIHPISADTLLSIKGVIESNQETFFEQKNDKLIEALKVSFIKALDQLVEVRLNEGSKLKEILNNSLNKIETLINDAVKSADLSKDVIKENIILNVNSLLQKEINLENYRLYEELALIYTRSDITEELDRLNAHYKSVKDLLAYNGPIGRKLDFILQELNREANTLCSKSVTYKLNSIGLNLKIIFDQLREQVQNVE
tara:strand:+ start:197 stop:1069 length:873 start_codon:yes stop_codon:yes gene_type:complete